MSIGAVCLRRFLLRIITLPIDKGGTRCVDYGTAIADGFVFRPVNGGGQAQEVGLSEKLVVAPRVHCRGGRPTAHMREKCRTAGGELEQLQLPLGHASVQGTERYLGMKQDLVHTPNGIKLRVAVSHPRRDANDLWVPIRLPPTPLSEWPIRPKANSVASNKAVSGQSTSGHKATGGYGEVATSPLFDSTVQDASGAERMESGNQMTNLTIQIPDDLARGLAGIASAQKKSVEQVALERLRSLFDRGKFARSCFAGR